MRYRDLGPVDLDRDGATQRIPGKRLTAALSYLLIHPNRWVSADALIEALWGESTTTADSKGTLASHLWRLRNVLEPDRQRGQAPISLLSDARGYRLQVAPDDIDSVRFERLTVEARDLVLAGQYRRARDRCDEAVALWRGLPWFPHSDEPWAAPAVARLLEVRADLQVQRITALVELGDIGSALPDLETALAEHPLRERLWSLRMRAQVRAGRTDQALATFTSARRVFIDELGIEPGPELSDLHARILAEDPALAGPPPVPVAAVRAQPALRSSAIPVRRTPVFGRSEEIASLAGSLQTSNLVTVVGPGGCGKTTLATETARTAQPDFPDGVLLVDLTAVGSRQGLLDAVLSELKLAPGPGESVEASLAAFARSRRMLLVLDNCEQVLDEVAALVDVLLEPGAELAVLATSREPLNLDGELVWDLQPLWVTPSDVIEQENGAALRSQPAVQLFLARLHASAPRLKVDEHTVRLAALICSAVDGIPLAIELAASQARAYTLDDILGRVRSDLAGLARIGRGSAPHHASLGGAIDLSVSTMSAAELAAHQAVTVIPGPFTRFAAGALLGHPPTPVDTTLGQLVHRSMLTALNTQSPFGTSRFAQLVLIRSHGAGQLTSSSRQALEDRRDAWVVRLMKSAPRVGASAEVPWLSRIDDDLAAVRATLQRQIVERPSAVGAELVSRLWLYWFYRGMLAEWERWARLASQITLDPFQQLLATLSHAAALTGMGRPERLGAALDAVDNYSAVLTSEEQVILAEQVFGFGIGVWTTRDVPTIVRVQQLIAGAAASTGDAVVMLLADLGRFGVDVLTDHRPPHDTFIEAERLWKQARERSNHYAGWIVATWASLAALKAADARTGLTWSDRAFDQYRGLGSGGLSIRIELRAALHAISGDHERAVTIDSASRAFARRANLNWPIMRETRPLIARSTANLRPAQRDRAERLGAQLTLEQIVAR